MLLLRREYRDGAEPPEIVLLHAEVTLHEGPTAMDGLVPRQAGMPRVLLPRPAGPSRRFTRAVVPSETPGRRVAYLPLPEPGEGERVLVRYRFSTVGGGEERFSPWYETDVPSDDAIADLYRIPEEGTSNLPPAMSDDGAGRGNFKSSPSIMSASSSSSVSAGFCRGGCGACRLPHVDAPLLLIRSSSSALSSWIMRIELSTVWS